MSSSSSLRAAFSTLQAARPAVPTRRTRIWEHSERKNEQIPLALRPSGCAAVFGHDDLHWIFFALESAGLFIRPAAMPGPRVRGPDDTPAGGPLAPSAGARGEIFEGK